MRILSRFLLALSLAGLCVQPAYAQLGAVRAVANSAFLQAVQAKAAGTRQSLGNDLRAAYRNASVSNPLIRPQLALPSAWVTATAYAKGTVLANGGHYYVTNGNCTSGATAPTWTDSRAGNDGACGLLYVGDPLAASADANAPTVSDVTGSTAQPYGNGSTVVWSPATYPNVYRVIGATTATTATTGWAFTSVFHRSGASIGQGYQVCAIVKDYKFAIGFTSTTSGASVAIDGQFVSLDTVKPGSGTPWWRSYDFSATTGYKSREVRITANSLGAFNFMGIATTTGGMVSPCPGRKNAVFISDSYDDGSSYHAFSAYGLWGTQIGWRLGWDVWHMSQGGSGLQNNAAANSRCSSASPNYCYTYVQRIEDIYNQARVTAADIIIEAESINDSSYNTATQQALYTSHLTRLRQLNPTALIVMIGVTPLSSSYSSLVAEDSANAAGFAAWSDPAGTGMSCRIPVLTAPNPPVDGSFRSGAPANLNTLAKFINATDNAHPSDFGLFQIAAWDAEQIATVCLPNVK